MEIKKKTAIVMMTLFVAVISANAYSVEAKQPAQAFSSDSKVAEDGLQAYNAKDYSKAIKLLQPLVAKGNPKALAVMGLAYQFGNGVAQNNKEAARLMELAYEKGWRGSIENDLGLHYLYGTGGTRNLKRAEQYFLAAGENDQYAQRNLADLYLSEPEFFNAINLQKASNFARNAVALGNESANILLTTAECALKNTGSEKATWDNKKHLAGYDLHGNVMKVSWGGDVLLFGKSGSILLDYKNIGLTNMSTRYFYGLDCNLIREDHTKLNASDAQGIHTFTRLEFTWENREIRWKDAKGTNWNSAALSYSYLPDGSTFTVEKFDATNGTTEYSHRDRDGQLKWGTKGFYSSEFGLPILHSAGTSYSPKRITRDSQGYISYDHGYYFTYANNGQLIRVVDHAGMNGQERGTLKYEYDTKGLLMRAVYSENYDDDIQMHHNKTEETTFDQYEVDEKGNWTGRANHFPYQGRILDDSVHRRIVYWD